MFFSFFKFDHQSDFCVLFSYHRFKLSYLLKTKLVKNTGCPMIWSVW